MSTRRTARVASMIREVVSNAILFELRDPRIKNVTVLGAQVSPDLRHAAVRISVMGDEKTAALSMHGLTSARGYLQSKVAEYIKSRYTPELRFVLDDSILKSIQTSAILRDVLDTEEPNETVTNETVAIDAEDQPTVPVAIDPGELENQIDR
ncbi:MAG TPA: 30S ribosome-binding factor RbfA [Planctomycetaceae bacterium]|nr:30S ribosome-binding factor RbfA [Planctomycetaceae bacterium]HRA86583.1 30S ribosome-binding factor RbfA [Planctomycetaceae bacterium]